jgi:hypothetical protein
MKNKVFVGMILAVIAFAVATALMLPESVLAASCSNKGQGKVKSCRIDPDNPPECPPCEEFDTCKCRCMHVPGCQT